MSFDEYDDSFVWRCDDCRLTVEFPTGDFYACLGELKARGWRMTRDDRDRVWSHKCGKCVRKAAEVSILDRPLVVARFGK